jgi:predicted lipoprotein with Yx(FWY)xxD motif
MALYMFITDTPGKSSCSGGCLAAWPPFYATAVPKVSSGVDAGKITLVDVGNGKKQVQYGDWLLYYYAKDIKAGDTTGQDVGKKWYVIGTDGKPIGMASAATTSSSG